MASCGFHAAKMTSATAIQPRPPTLSLSHTPPLMIMLQYAPPMPQMPAPMQVDRYLYSVTLMPAASAVAGFSPTARRFRPARVRVRNQCMATASTMAAYTRKP